MFYRAGIGTIDNQKLKDFAAERSNAILGFFKKRIRKQNQPNEVTKEEITKKYDKLVFGKEEENWHEEDCVEEDNVQPYQGYRKMYTDGSGKEEEAGWGFAVYAMEQTIDMFQKHHLLTHLQRDMLKYQ